MSGIVSSIQRFSLHDGPGIRTTVFFQGCQMRCAWCHNPETISTSPKALWYEHKCIKCGTCLDICPNIISGRTNIPNSCTGCGKCVATCPADALRLSGYELSEDEIMREVTSDQDFYRSGGGVTFSGGEPLLQEECLAELLKRSKNNGIHTAIETNLNYDWKRLESLLDNIDLIMFDLKCMDSELHRKYTGTGNEKIIGNIHHLGRSGKALIARTPLVNGINDSENNIVESARLLGKLKNLQYYELLSYHPLGMDKYSAVGIEKTEFQPPDLNHITHLNNYIKKYGIRTNQDF